MQKIPGAPYRTRRCRYYSVVPYRGSSRQLFFVVVFGVRSPMFYIFYNFHRSTIQNGLLTVSWTRWTTTNWQTNILRVHFEHFPTEQLRFLCNGQCVTRGGFWKNKPIKTKQQTTPGEYTMRRRNKRQTCCCSSGENKQTRVSLTSFFLCK